jgi:PAS domain S-box-containing protein
VSATLARPERRQPTCVSSSQAPGRRECHWLRRGRALLFLTAAIYGLDLCAPDAYAQSRVDPAPDSIVAIAADQRGTPLLRLIVVGALLAGSVGAMSYGLGRMRQRARTSDALVPERPRELPIERPGTGAAAVQLDAAKALELSHAQLLSIFEHLHIGVIIVDAQQRVRFASPAIAALIGGAAADMIGQPLKRVLPVDAEALAEIERQLRSPSAGSRVTVELGPSTGPRYRTEIEARQDPRDERNRIVYLHDIRETCDREPANEAGPQDGIAGLLGKSSSMQEVRDQVRVLAAVDATVLIEGETGTGKEMVARAIHNLSDRRGGPFVAINCAGLTESLLASQLFGHRRGAFTGAVNDHVGLFEAAQGGTLLLDEIGDMPMSVQTHLLRVLQEREILRLGDSKPRPIDVRVLAATHRSLEREVAEGRFRQDLLYRIRVARLALPALRERPEDIPLLAVAFVQEFNAAHGKTVTGIGRNAMDQLMARQWSGNVRELRAVIEWAVIRATGPTIRPANLPRETTHGEGPLSRSGALDDERRQIMHALAQTGGNRAVAARLLGISRATLYRKMAGLDLELPDVGAES